MSGAVGYRTKGLVVKGRRFLTILADTTKLHISLHCQTYRMSVRTTRFGTFTCTHCSKHWIKAIATSATLSIRWFLVHPAKTCVPTGGQPIALHTAKAIVTMLKVVFTFRYVTRTPAITANPRIQSNPEAIPLY